MRNLVLVAVGAALVGALGAVLGFGASTAFWTQETAAWVQAVGSLLGLVVAIGVPQFQQSERLKHDREYALRLAVETHRQICGLWIMATDPAAHAELIEEDDELKTLQQLQHDLTAFPVLSLQSVEATAEIANVRRNLSAAMDAFLKARQANFPADRAMQLWLIASDCQKHTSALLPALGLLRERFAMPPHPDAPPNTATSSPDP